MIAGIDIDSLDDLEFRVENSIQDNGCFVVAGIDIDC